MPQNKAFVELVEEAKEAVKFLNDDIAITDEEKSEMIGHFMSAISAAEQELTRQEGVRVFEGKQAFIALSAYIQSENYFTKIDADGNLVWVPHRITIEKRED